MKIFNVTQVVPSDVSHEDAFVDRYSEQLVLQAFRAGYYLPELPTVSRWPDSFAKDFVRVEIRAYGLRIGEPE